MRTPPARAPRGGTPVRGTAGGLALGGLALAGLVVLAPGAASPAPTADPAADLPFILSQAQRVQKVDLAAWTRFRFRRQIEREDYDDAGGVTDRQDSAFEVTPVEGGFMEVPIGPDGRPSEPSDRKRNRRSGGFDEHYRALVAGAGGEEEEGGYSLGRLLHLSSYRYTGREVRNGVDCFRLDFEPDSENASGGGLAGRFTEAMHGSLWITVEGFHLAAARAETERPIAIALWLSKVYDLQVSLEARPVGEGIWLPSRLELRTHARILFKGIRRMNRFDYDGFERLPPPG